MIRYLTFKPIPTYEQYFDDMEKQANKGRMFNLFRAQLEKLDTDEKKRKHYEAYTKRIKDWQAPLIKHFGEESSGST